MHSSLGKESETPAGGWGEEKRKMLNITNDQVNANQNHNVIPPYSCKNGHNQKNIKTVDVGMDSVNVEHFYPAGGNVNCTVTMENSVEIP